MNAGLIGKERFKSLSFLLVFTLIFTLVLGLGSPPAAYASPNHAPQAPAAVLPTAWAPLNDTGLSNSVNAIAVFGTNVYVGGSFTASYNGIAYGLYYIARYDTVYGTWHNLGAGLNGPVRALALDSLGNLYAGGDFTNLGDNSMPELAHIAKWTVATSTWSPLFSGDLGLNGSVMALAFESATNDLWVGGSFNDTVDTPHLVVFQHLARFNTLGASWSQVQCKGLNAEVDALVVSGSNIYVGGSFSTTADTAGTCSNTAKTHLNRIAKYSGGTSWTALTDNGLLGQGVSALAVDAGGTLYAGGSFDSSYGLATLNLNNFAIYSGTTWVSPSTFHNGLDNNAASGNVNVLAVIGTDLYVGGNFTKTADSLITSLNNLMIYRAGSWVTPPGNGLRVGSGGGSVDAIAYTGLPTLYNVYMGGAFNGSGDGLSTNLNFIASLANACNATGSGSWGSASTWSCGEVPTTADQVTIPSNMTVTLNVDATVNGKLTLNGNLDGSASGKILTLGPSAVVAGAGDVLGIVQRIAPLLGAALAYNNATTTVTLWSSSPALMRVKLTKGRPGTMASYVSRKYTLIPVGLAPLADVKLSYKASELVRVSNESDLQLYRYDSGLKKWVLQGGFDNIISHSVSKTNVVPSSDWAFFESSPFYLLFNPLVRK